MKFFTKKSKIVFLVILLVGSILLAYNSLHHKVEYYDLNKHLDGSSTQEGFHNNDAYGNNNNDAYGNNNNDAYGNNNNDAYGNNNAYDNNEMNNNPYGNNNNAYSNNNNNNDEDEDNESCRHKNRHCRKKHHRHSYNNRRSNDDGSFLEKIFGDKTDKYNDNNNNNNNGYQYSDSYDKFNNSANSYSNATADNSIMNEYDARSSYSKKKHHKKDKHATGYIPKAHIPKGSEDLYILKSEIVPPVCPVCPSVTPCPNKPTPPCPACARCPEPSFECKKVPNYGNNQSDLMPMPVLNDFSTFGM